jgi:ribonuclease III
MVQALDLVHRRARQPDRLRDLSELAAWVEDVLGARAHDLALFDRALTHSSHKGPTYERLEFLGDRVLGLVIADWLYQLHPDDPEGKLSHRLNSLVARTTCAEVARAINLASRIKLGKQALDDGAFASDNVLGDVVESLIGALFVDQGLEAATGFVRRYWQDHISEQTSAPRHPKSELQEWAAAHNRKAPAYTVVDRSGPDHAPRFRVKVSLGSAGEAEAEGRSKQEAESAAAGALLGVLGS